MLSICLVDVAKKLHNKILNTLSFCIGLEAGERPKSATKKGAKEEERARKEREKEEKKREKMNGTQ